ncbi:PAS domain S-box protein [candidate division GN15 bacterium]|nr:PAS domain S-box protein [candidate division GN15 bacterium]
MGASPVTRAHHRRLTTKSVKSAKDSAIPARLSGRGVNRLAGIANDAETAARDSRFHDIVDFLPDPTFAIDLEGRVIAWNHAMEQATGVKADEVLGRDDFVYAEPYYGESRPILINLVLSFDEELAARYESLRIDGDTLTAEIQVPGLHSGGGYLSAKAGPLYDSAGKVVGAIETTRDITELKRTQQALEEASASLEAERQLLQEKNAALREIIRQVDTEKQQLASQIQGNIDRVVKPMLRSVKARSDASVKKSLLLISTYLDEITAPFVNKLETAYRSLSPREMQICSMIRDGMSCKEIAESLSVSVNTVLNQRQRIRHKLGISRRKVNLRSFLRSL